MLELLLPAGNLKKLKTAIHFGADAVYVGGKDFSLRAFADNFTDEELNEMIEGTVPSISSHAGGIVGMLQKNPLLRQLYYQFDSYRSKGKSEATYEDIIKYIAP